MRKGLVAVVAMMLVVAIAMPALAAVEFKYGGQFRVRWLNNDHFDGTSVEGTNDNQNFLDQRLRMYFTFIASENLRVVTKFEVGDTIWGNAKGPWVWDPKKAAFVQNPRFGDTGRIGADAVAVEVKNAYMEFNIPQTPLKAYMGVQGVNLLNSWIVDEDLSAAVVHGKFDPIKVQVGYVAAQTVDLTTWQDRADAWFAAIDYAQGPWSGSLIGYFQNGRNTAMSADPATMVTPVAGPLEVDRTVEVDDAYGASKASAYFNKQMGLGGGGTASYLTDNQLFDLGLNLAYKLSYLSAYFTFVKNLGGFHVDGEQVKDGLDVDGDASYTGWMIDAGVNYFCGPYTLNLGGFYTTGNDVQDKKFHDFEAFTYPMATTKYFSEIMGGGILDYVTTVAHTDAAGAKDYQWRGYQMPSNIWTVTLGGAWQAMEKTKLSASYWYFGTSSDVESGFTNAGRPTYSNEIGHELNFYVTQGIVDGLTLDLVGAYLIAGDAFTSAKDKEDVYELGARLQWSF
jgi:hypothetical protein